MTIKRPTTPQTRCYATLQAYIDIQNSE